MTIVTALMVQMSQERLRVTMGNFGVRTRDTWDSLFLVAVLMTVYVTAATGQTKNTRIQLARITAGKTGKETRRLQAEAEEKRRVGAQKKQELIEQAKVIVAMLKKLKTLRDKLKNFLKAKKEEATRYKDVGS